MGGEGTRGEIICARTRIWQECGKFVLVGLQFAICRTMRSASSHADDDDTRTTIDDANCSLTTGIGAKAAAPDTRARETKSVMELMSKWGGGGGGMTKNNYVEVMCGARAGGGYSVKGRGKAPTVARKNPRMCQTAERVSRVGRAHKKKDRRAQQVRMRKTFWRVVASPNRIESSFAFCLSTYSSSFVFFHNWFE